MAGTGQLDDRFGNSATFDYESLSPAVAKFLRGQAVRIRQGYTTSIIQIGKALIEAKRHLPHGGFGCWVRLEAGIPMRTAQVYMQVAQWAKDKNATIAQLPPSILYMLSGRSTPEEFTVMLLEQHVAGEHIDARVAREQLKAMRQAKSANPELETTAAEPPKLQRRVDNGNKETEVALGKVVGILVNRLSSPEFEEVRNIMTSRTVLQDPNFTQNIVTAFYAASRCLSREIERIDTKVVVGIDGTLRTGFDEGDAGCRSS
jgi:hypothetical protein